MLGKVKKYWPYVGTTDYGACEPEAKMMVDSAGDYVKYSDYEKLEVELEKTKKELALILELLK
jgi:hypothetical protein